MFGPGEGIVNLFTILPNTRPIWHTHPCNVGKVIYRIGRRRK
jgi:hypothetical protein